MAKKTRYLQVSDIMMFEMTMLGDGDHSGIQNPTSFIYTRLMDGHTLLLSPVSYECVERIDPSTNEIVYVKSPSPMSLNNINHLAVPKDPQCSMWYSFLDPDYEYVDGEIMNQIINTQVKAKSYDRYLSNPVNSNSAPLEQYYSSISDMRWDTARLYFVNGYDFSNIGGILMRITVDGNDRNGETERKIDLCDFFVTRSNAYRLVKYLSSPIMFGNNIYDRYIEVNIACLYDLINGNNGDPQSSMYPEVDVKANTTMKLSFSYVMENEMEVSTLEYTLSQLVNLSEVTTDMVECSFTRSSVLNGTIPVGNINSDNLGAYIAECTDMPYLVFYATWKDQPLTQNIVWQFNKGITLYDTSLIRQDYEYEVDPDYTAQSEVMKKWVCMHEIKCSFCMGSYVVKEETYSMTQIFMSDQDPDRFYYRPIIFDETVGTFIDNVQIVYTMRFMNVNDKVQFVKVASLSLSDGLEKFYAKGTSLTAKNLTPYKIYNKVVEHKHEHVGGQNGPQRTKYVKVFYSSTEVVLDDNGNVTTGDYTYTLNVSQAPKSYKFTFKRIAPNGTYYHMDMSNSYFKLLYRDADGADNLIDPTYSQNMNLYVGELEFNFNSVTVNKLSAVEEGNRKMSIVAYNEDGSVSSMFDFLYSI